MVMTQHGKLIVETLTNGPFQENCFVASDADTRKAILIDPGDEEEMILSRVRELDLEVTEIVCTHTHIDHAGAVAPLKRMLGVNFAVHAGEIPGLGHMPQAAAMFGLPTKEIPEVERQLEPGGEVAVGDLVARVLFTPGHSAGGICLLFSEQKVVFVGDTLFCGSVGRTDLPGGSGKTLIASITEQLLTLDDDVVAYSGHGPETTIGAERRNNAFLQPGNPFLF